MASNVQTQAETLLAAARGGSSSALGTLFALYQQHLDAQQRDVRREVSIEAIGHWLNHSTMRLESVLVEPLVSRFRMHFQVYAQRFDQPSTDNDFRRDADDSSGTIDLVDLLRNGSPDIDSSGDSESFEGERRTRGTDDFFAQHDTQSSPVGEAMSVNTLFPSRQVASTAL